MEDLFDRYDPGGMEVLRRLEAYADAQLTPTVAVASRVRAGVMAAAHQRATVLLVAAAAGAADTTTAAAPAPVVPDRPAPLAIGSWRRAFAAAMAGTITLAILAGTAFAARPGGLLYPARLWTEAANLPATGLARAQAEIDRLTARLVEAQQAAAAGDGPAVQAAIVAYTAIVAEAAAGLAGDAEATAALEETVARHVAILTALLGRVPAPAQAAIQNALASSTKVLDAIHDGSSPAGGGSAGGGGGTGGSGGGAPGGPGSGPDVTPTADPPKPTPPGHTKTPRPTRTDDQEQSGQPSSPTEPPGKSH